MKYLMLVLVFLSFNVNATNWRHHDNEPVVNNFFSYPTFEQRFENNSEIAKATVMAMASGHPFDYTTLDWQAGINGAYYDGQDAMSFALAKRFEAIDILFYAEFMINDNDQAYKAGGIWRFASE